MDAHVLANEDLRIFDMLNFSLKLKIPNENRRVFSTGFMVDTHVMLFNRDCLLQLLAQKQLVSRSGISRMYKDNADNDTTG